MTLLNLLERLGEMPAEVWLLPPVVILSAMAVTGLLRRSLRLRRFRAIAERAGLSVKAKVINASEIRGTFRGRPLVMTIVSRRRPTFRRRWTRVAVDVKNPEIVGMHLRLQDVLDNLVISAGMMDLQVGDAAFDRRFVIHSRDTPLVFRLFQDRERRDALLRADVDSVDLSGSRLDVYCAREERDPAHAELLFAAAAGLADGVDALQSEDRPEIISTERP